MGREVAYVIPPRQKQSPPLWKAVADNVPPEGPPIKISNDPKYLGVTISSSLSWKKHIDSISTKASKTLGFLRRNLKVGSIAIKDQAYKAMVRPQLEYACEVWDPHTANNIQSLEKIQRRAARWVVNCYRQTSSVGDMLEELEWQPLEDRRRRTRWTTL